MSSRHRNLFKQIKIGLIIYAIIPPSFVFAKMRLPSKKVDSEIKSETSVLKTNKNARNKISPEAKNKNGPEYAKRSNDKDGTIFGIGLIAGSTATYGNGLVVHIDPFDYLGTQIGLGFNSTGAKLGAGATFILPVSKTIGFDAGGAVVHSYGTKDKVSLGAKFTPENSSTTEDVEAIRKFRLSPANYYSVFVGSFYDFTDIFRIELHANYNKVISGNYVEFYDEVSYSKPVEANNDGRVQQDFEPKARSKLSINGVGFSLGMQFRL